MARKDSSKKDDTSKIKNTKNSNRTSKHKKADDEDNSLTNQINPESSFVEIKGDDLIFKEEKIETNLEAESIDEVKQPKKKRKNKANIDNSFGYFGLEMSEFKYLTTKEACALLNVTRHTLYKAIKEGKVKANKFGRDYRVKLSDLKNL